MHSQHEYSHLACKPYYNLKWDFPIRELANHRVKLVPWVSELYAEAFFQGVCAYPSFYDNIHVPPFTSSKDVKSMIDGWVDPKIGWAIFAMLDVSQPNAHALTPPLAGIIALGAPSVRRRCFEISVLTLPVYHRHNLSMHAIGLVLEYAFAPAPVGLGLRRVECRAAVRTMEDLRNSPTVRLAKKIGCTQEGVQRWFYAYPPGRSGMPGEEEDDRASSRHAVLLSICWDDWENGAKKRIASWLWATEASAKL
ncbi:hypothetical protein HWV62_25410 [Athelia sp. TMB]|nr:hypothetical protein HWV62_25410 [Athelia sp. TMB]